MRYNLTLRYHQHHQDQCQFLADQMLTNVRTRSILGNLPLVTQALQQDPWSVDLAATGDAPGLVLTREALDVCISQPSVPNFVGS